MTDFEEKRIESIRVFTGEVLELNLDTVILPNGKRAPREWISHKGAVGIVPLKSDGTLVLVEQFRYPTGNLVVEIPAGKLDEGEDPLDCAARELREEIGVDAENMKKLSAFYTSPGYSNELFHLYIARGLTPVDSSRDDDEFLRIVELPLSEALESVSKNEIVDAKTIIGIVLAARELGLLHH